MMLGVVLFLCWSLGAHAASEACDGDYCQGFWILGVTYDHYCPVDDGNLLLTLPPEFVTNVQQCEKECINMDQCLWYNYRPNVACQLLSHCKEPLAEAGSVLGPDPGDGDSCHTEPTTNGPTPLPTTTEPINPGQQEVLLVIGGNINAVWGTMMVEVITENLEVITGLFPPVPRPGFSWHASVLDDQVIVCGGENNLRDCQHLDLTPRIWGPSSKLVQERVRTEPVVHNGTMFIFGGRDGAALNSVEEYNRESHSWTTVNEWSMPQDLYDFCAFEHENYIYHVGGYHQPSSSTISTVRRLNTATNVYETMPSMLQPRRGHQCIITTIKSEEGILVTGGSDNFTTEFYSFADQKWSYLADMNTPRSSHGIGILKGQVIVFGGYASGHLDSIEIYSQFDEKWLIVDSVLTNTKWGFAYVKTTLLGI